MSGNQDWRRDMSPADRAYRVLLRLYPREFRQRFGSDMVDFFRDRRLAAHRTAGTLGVARAWARAIVTSRFTAT